MKFLNKVTLVGNLEIDPKVIDTHSGHKFVTFTLATHESWKDKDDNYVQETEWYKIVVFNEQSVAFAQSSLKKGDQVYLEGKIKSQKWIGEDGNKRTNFEIILPRFGGELKKVPSVESPKKSLIEEWKKAGSPERTTALKENCLFRYLFYGKRGYLMSYNIFFQKL